MIEAVCPNCSMIYLLKNEKANQIGVCNLCRAKFSIPSPIQYENLNNQDKTPRLENIEISTKKPGLLVFLVDQSGSMNKTFPKNVQGELGIRKDCVAETINKLLYNLILRSTEGDGIKDRFYSALYGYRGKEVEDYFHSFKSVGWIANNTLDVINKTIEQKGPQGETIKTSLPVPIWLHPKAEGHTPMHQAFSKVLDALKHWITKYPDSYPPIIFNITDGSYTDKNPNSIVKEIFNLKIKSGRPIVMNCHISDESKQKLIFPSNDEMKSLDGLHRIFYEFSSILPHNMVEMAKMKGYLVNPGARGFAYNADMTTLIDLLTIGTPATETGTIIV